MTVSDGCHFFLGSNEYHQKSKPYVFIAVKEEVISLTRYFINGFNVLQDFIKIDF
jgi:hypothetical protein